MRFLHCSLFDKLAAFAVFGMAISTVGVFAQDKPIQVPATLRTAPKPGVELLQKKLKSIVIDKVDIKKMDIKDVVQFLQAKSKEFDPDKVGVNFVLRLTTPEEDARLHIHREVSVTLDNVPMDELLGFITMQTNLQYSVSDYAVYIRPAIEDAEDLSVRTYLAPANFLAILPPVRGEAPKREDGSIDVKQQLSALGFKFAVGTTAIYLPGPSKLVVRNTPTQLDLIFKYIEKLSTGNAPPADSNSGTSPDK